MFKVLPFLVRSSHVDATGRPHVDYNDLAVGLVVKNRANAQSRVHRLKPTRIGASLFNRRGPRARVGKREYQNAVLIVDPNVA